MWNRSVVENDKFGRASWNSAYSRRLFSVCRTGVRHFESRSCEFGRGATVPSAARPVTYVYRRRCFRRRRWTRWHVSWATVAVCRASGRAVTRDLRVGGWSGPVDARSVTSSSITGRIPPGMLRVRHGQRTFVPSDITPPHWPALQRTRDTLA